MRPAIITSLFFLLFILGCSRDPEPITQFRPATPADLTGVWQQMTVQAYNPQMDLSDPWFSGSQIYWFKEAEPVEGEEPVKQFAKLIIQEGKEVAYEDIKDIWADSPWQVYLEWYPEGRTIMTFPQQQRKYPILITAYTEDFDTSDLPGDQLEAMKSQIPMKGDITFTYVNKEGQPQFFRLLRRVPTEE